MRDWVDMSGGVRVFASGSALVAIGLWVAAAGGPWLGWLGLCVVGAVTCLSGACQRVLESADAARGKR